MSGGRSVGAADLCWPCAIMCHVGMWDLKKQDLQAEDTLLKRPYSTCHVLSYINFKLQQQSNNLESSVRMICILSSE